MHPKGAKKNKLAQAIFSKDGPNLTRPDVTSNPNVTPKIYNVTNKKIKGMPLKELYETSPFGMVSSLFYGTIQSALFTLLAVYAASMNFTIFQISLVTFLLAISGAISQYPIGKLSDKFDRRLVIIYSTLGASFFALCAILASGQMYLPGELATSNTWFYIFLIFNF